MLKLISDKCSVYYQSHVNPTELYDTITSTVFEPAGEFLVVGFGSLISNDAFPVHLINELIQKNFGILYFCDALPEKPIVDPHIIYIKCEWAWFSHTLLVDYMSVVGTFGSGQSTQKMSERFSRLGAFTCTVLNPVLSTSGDIQAIVDKHSMPATRGSIQGAPKTLLFDVISHCPDRGLGDIIMTLVPLYKLHLQGWRIDYLARPAAARLLEQIPWLNKVYGTSHDLSLSYSGTFADMPNPKEYTWHFTLAQGLEDYRVPRNLQCRVDSICELLRLKPETIADKVPKLYLTDEERGYGAQFKSPDKPTLVLGVISTGSVSRSYPMRYLDRLITLLTRKFHVVLVDQHPIKVDQHVDLVNLTGKLNIRQWMSVIANADLVASTDTGIYWVALGLGVPSVVFFTTIPPEMRVKYYPGMIYPVDITLPCKPCYDRQMVRDKESWTKCREALACSNCSPCASVYTPELVYQHIKVFSISRRIL